jgi:hypothetical protein
MSLDNLCGAEMEKNKYLMNYSTSNKTRPENIGQRGKFQQM